MISKDLKVLNRAGIHARPAAVIAKTAAVFDSDIFFEIGTMKVNAKSIMGIITLGATFGTIVHCTCAGRDEEEAAKAMEDLFMSRFEQE